MKLNKYIPVFILFLSSYAHSQAVDYIGLSGKHITSLKANYGILAVGTNYNGVYWHDVNSFSATDWHEIDIDSVKAVSVYPHKSGPLGWAIGIGTEHTEDNSSLIFCSYLGEEPRILSYGLDTNITRAIEGIDGFPDPTICGETFAIGGRKLYRRFFNDTIWHSVRDLTIEGNFASIKAREEFADVYAGGGEGFAGILLIRSSDKGETWEDLFPFCYGAEIDFWGDTVQTIFVTDRRKLMRSTDDGATWDNVFETDTLLIQKISFSDDGKIFSFAANTLWYDIPRSYLFYTANLGKSWEIMQLPINDLIAGMDVGPDYVIYLASISDGVFRVALPVSDIGEKEQLPPEDFKLFNNYPNPFNSETKIKYSLSYPSKISLKVYDALSREIMVLADGEKDKGTYEINFKADGLVSGIYFLRLQAGSYSQTKRIVFLK